MYVCQDCWNRAEENGDYISPSVDERISDPSRCDMHPDMDNWRFWRALESLRYWGGMPEGYMDERNGTSISLGEGWVDRKCAEEILFDYEKYFIDFAIEQGLVEQSGAFPMSVSVRLTEKGNKQLWDSKCRQ